MQYERSRLKMLGFLCTVNNYKFWILFPIFILMQKEEEEIILEVSKMIIHHQPHWVTGEISIKHKLYGYSFFFSVDK